MSLDAFLLGVLFGFLISLLVFWLWYTKTNRSNNKTLALFEQEKKQLSDSLLAQTAQIAVMKERLSHAEDLGRELLLARQSLEVAKEEYSQLYAQKVSVEIENKKTVQYLELRIADLQAIQEQMKESFTVLSQDALIKNAELVKSSFKETLEHYYKVSEKDRSLSHELLANIMKPLKESLISVDTKVGDLEVKRQGAYDGLKEQIEGLLKSQTLLQKETQNLAQALHAPTVRGRWGEMQLKRVVELSGLSSHCDFVEQKSIKEGDGLLRPDMIVTLPKNKKIVIDAKAPLEFLVRMADDGQFLNKEEERCQQLAASLRRHLLTLKKKSYHSALGETPEFVVMFLPGEAFLHWALLADPLLLDFAAQNEILITTPITLVALLKAIAFGFSQESIAHNIEEVRKLSKQLIDRVNTVSSHFERLGKSLKQSVDAYNQTLASLDSRVLVTARKLSEIRSIANNNEDYLKNSLPAVEAVPRIKEFSLGTDGEKGT